MQEKAQKSAREAEKLVQDATLRYNEMLKKSNMDKDKFDQEFKATRLARWASENAETAEAAKRLQVALDAAAAAEARRAEVETSSKKAIAESKAQQAKAEKLILAAKAKQEEAKKATEVATKAKQDTEYAAAVAKATRAQAAELDNFKEAKER
jgi:hypothetical protein